jgi:hypothetical protein
MLTNINNAYSYNICEGEIVNMNNHSKNMLILNAYITKMADP